MQTWKSYAEVALALLVLLDPLGAIPVFVTLTANHSPEERAHTINIASATAFVVLAIAFLTGDPLFHVLGISIGAFEVAGGIVLILVAVAMLHARPTRVKRADEEVGDAAHESGIAVVPLGIPIAAGPGAISAALIYGQREKNWADATIVMLIIGLVVISFWMALRLAGPTKRVLGTTGINVVNRLLGLFLLAVAVQFIARGALQLFPALSGPVL